MNPFATLGFNTTVLGGISDKDIVSLVHSSYKALSKIHHPDAGGNSKVFQLVKQAYEELQDDDYRAEALREYRLPRQDRLDFAEAEVFQLEKGLDSFIRSFVCSKLENEFSPLSDHGVVLFRESQLELGVENSHEEDLEKQFDDDLLGCYKVLHINGRSVQMTSLLKDDSSYKIPACAKALTPQKWGKTTGKSRSKFLIADRWYKKDLESYELKPEPKDESEPIGKSEPKDVLYRFVEAKPKDHDLVLIGSISSEVFHTTQEPTKGLKALPVGLIVQNTGYIKDGSPYEQAKHYLRSLELNFKADQYLIGCREVKEEIRYYIIGQILSFDAI